MSHTRRLRAATSTALIVFLVLAALLAAGLYTTYLVISWVKAGVTSVGTETQREFDTARRSATSSVLTANAAIIVRDLRSAATTGHTSTAKVIAASTVDADGLWLRGPALASPLLVPVVGTAKVSVPAFAITLSLDGCSVVVTGSASKAPTAAAGPLKCS